MQQTFLECWIVTYEVQDLVMAETAEYLEGLSYGTALTQSRLVVTQSTF